MFSGFYGRWIDDVLIWLINTLESIPTIVRTATAEGEFRDDVDHEQFAFELHALTLGYHQATRLLDDEQATRRAHASFERLLACSRP